MKHPSWQIASILGLLLTISPALSSAESQTGEQQFKRCKACHGVQDGENGIGPHLFGIVGRSVAAVEGYRYSKGMQAYAEDGLIWDISRLRAFLTKPREEVRGTKMSFSGFREESHLADLIAYLETLK